jgi:hypothetical protein
LLGVELSSKIDLAGSAQRELECVNGNATLDERNGCGDCDVESV